jgi:hypothetical protein
MRNAAISAKQMMMISAEITRPMLSPGAHKESVSITLLLSCSPRSKMFDGVMRLEPPAAAAAASAACRKLCTMSPAHSAECSKRV